MSTALNEVVLEFDLADRMRKTLRHTGISVQQMADYLGVSRNTVGSWINGHTPPDRRTILLWAMRTGVPVEWLETGQVPTTPDGEGSSLMQPTEPYVLRRHLTVMHDIAA